MKKSLIISWISCCDYPLARAWLDKYHGYFDEIIIYFDVQMRYPFYWAFVQQSLSHLPNIKFLDPLEIHWDKGEDWRNTSTNELIKHATGDWVISIEQDFFVRNWDEFFDWCTKYMELADLFGWMNMSASPYIHPACFFIKRELLEKTSKDFGAHSEIPGSDHFGMITYDANRLNARVRNLPLPLEFSPDSFGYHLGGVNQNFLNGLTEGFQFHRPEAFMVYNYWCRVSPVLQDSRFQKLSLEIEDMLLKKFNKLTPIDNETDKWSKFFKI